MKRKKGRTKIPSEDLLLKGVREDNLRYIRKALDNGADVHAHNELPLRLALIRRNYNAVKMLLEAGADPHVGNDVLYLTFKSPFSTHLDPNEEEIYKLLLEYR